MHMLICVYVYAGMIKLRLHLKLGATNITRTLLSQQRQMDIKPSLWLIIYTW